MSQPFERIEPVAPNQRGLWLLDRLSPLSATYNLARCVRLTGPLDVSALQCAFESLVGRHDSLRTRFVGVDSEPAQVVLSAIDFVLRIDDLSSLGPARHERAECLMQEEARTGFALDCCPLLRARLLRLGEHEHVLLLTLHHIIADDHSLTVLWRELAALYEAALAGQPAALPLLPLQFADHVRRLHSQPQRDEEQRQLDYWKQSLAHLPELDLPTDRAPASSPSGSGRLDRFALTKELTAELRALSRLNGTTVFTTLLAALQVLLYRHSGQTDLTIGVAVLGRPRPEFMDVFGYFVNMLVVRCDLAESQSFVEHLSRVHGRTTEAYAHQDVPFDAVVRELAPRRDASRNPLFRLCMTKWSPHGQRLHLAGLVAADIETLDTGTAMFDLSVTVVERDGQAHLWMEYATELFDPSTIERLAGRLIVLLEGIVAEPRARLADLPMLTPSEHRQLMVDWNPAAATRSTTQNLADLFEAQALRTPDAVALLSGDQSFTYAQVDARANQLAHRLLASLPPGAGAPVAMCMERSAQSVIGVLAIHKAGATCLPLDPNYPSDRVAFMLDDSGAAVVLVNAATRTLFGAIRQARPCVDADADAQAISQCPERRPDRRSLGADDLACIIYTSGSTGVPKGVLLTHGGICNHQRWFGECLQLTPSDRVLHFTSIGFDASLCEMLAPLSAGACLYIARPNGERDVPYLARTIRDQRLTVLQAVPSVLRALVAEASFHSCTSLRYIVSGGGPLDYDLVASLAGAVPGARLGNFYGPTETSVDATFFALDAARRGSGLVPIGRPITNARCHVLDGERRLVPIGVVGELYIGGAGLARGYLNRPEQTAERFVADPFRPGERLYRSGDLARYLPDGVLAFVGRNDDQVKLRGFRIDPGEVGAVLSEHPDVRTCHVMARRQPNGDAGLAAYIVSALGTPDRPDFAALRRFLALRMPAHMIPTSFVAVADLPRTINGKVDSRALPDPGASDVVSCSEYVAPRDAVERTLCLVWADVLGVERVGLDDNFFEIGGHSLLAARLFARLDVEFGRSLMLGALFGAPTVRLLADHYRARAPSELTDTPRALVALRSEGNMAPLYLVPGVFGNVVGYADFVRELGPDQPVFGLQSIGLNGASEPFETIKAMAAHYVSEVREHQPHGPYALVGACFGATVAYEMARQLLASGEAVAFLGLLSPSADEFSKPEERGLPVPRVLKRALALGSMMLERLHVYRGDMRGLGRGERWKYVVKKMRGLGSKAVLPHAFKGAQRELNQIEVYRANLRALEGFVRQPLVGRLVCMEVLETQGSSSLKQGAPINWNTCWSGPIECHRVPGKDSGDMLTGANARTVATLLKTRLRLAFDRCEVVRVSEPRSDHLTSSLRARVSRSGL